MAWTKDSKPTLGSWHSTINDFLLQEIGDFILQENGSKIYLEESDYIQSGTWTKDSEPA